MIDKAIYQEMSAVYKKDLLYDILLKNDHNVTFYFNLQHSPTILTVITGDITKLHLPKRKKITLKEIINYIETDNALAEVEGKKTFIEDLKDKIRLIKDNAHVYIPIKRDNKPLWLYVSFEVITVKDGKPELIFGRVNRLFESTPEEIINYQKTHQDPLTKLFTRETLNKHMTYRLTSDSGYGLYIDIDGFKSINDIHGHQTGDDFLKCIANHFINNWEANVLYYRLGGDEFFVYLKHFSEDKAIECAKKIIKDIETLKCNDKQFDVSASIGIVELQNDLSFQKILDLGDHAMYASKAKGRGNVTLVKDVK